MLVITCDMNYACGAWQSKGRNDKLTLCNDGLCKVFRVPFEVNVMTMSLYTTPAKERVRVRVHRNGYYVVNTDEPGVYRTWRAVPTWIWRVIRKYEGKPLYLAVTY